MTNPTIVFAVKTDQQGNPYLAAELDDAGLASNDIRVRFARLGMRYAQQVADAGPLPISRYSHGDQVTATLTFMQGEIHGDGEPFIEFDEGDEEFIDSLDPPVVDENAIGCSLKISHLGGNRDSRPFGWAASPAAMAATSVAKMVRVAIEQAAGVNRDVEADCDREHGGFI